jgi:hypothetical protein
VPLGEISLPRCCLFSSDGPAQLLAIDQGPSPHCPEARLFLDFRLRVIVHDVGAGRARESGKEDNGMKLTDAERQEFVELVQDTYDPELFTEEDYPMLRAAKEKYQKEQQEEATLQRKASGVKAPRRCSRTRPAP